MAECRLGSGRPPGCHPALSFQKHLIPAHDLMNNEIHRPIPPACLFGAENSAIWLVAIVGLSLSFAALLLIRQQLEAHKMLDFEWVAHNRIRALNHGLDNSMLAVTTLRDHVIASGRVDAEGFRVFAESLLDRYRGVKALVWVPLVNGSERERSRIVRSHRQGKDSEYWSATPVRFSYRLLIGRSISPICHAVPGARRQLSCRFRSGLDPRLRRDPVTCARSEADNGERAYRTFPLPGGGLEYGFMVATPVFAPTPLVQDAEPGRDQLTGFIVGFFRLGELDQHRNFTAGAARCGDPDP